MQRCRAIFVIVALLAAPLALVARGFAAQAGECSGYCCLPHGHHAHHSQDSSAKVTSDAMHCHHGDLGQMLNCSMRSSHPGLDYGLLSPLAPTAPSLVQRIAAPETARHMKTRTTVTLAAGFLAAPFEPPRS